jgi:mono/diheme cytochrome c family protein
MMTSRIRKHSLRGGHSMGARRREGFATARFCCAVLIVSLSTFAFTQSGKTVSAVSDDVLYAELTKAPRKAMARHNPLSTDPDAVAAGGKLYGMHCAECHGETGTGGHGSKKGPSLRAEEVQQASPGTLFWILTNGVVRRGMPVWSKLPELQRWQLVSFIKSLNAPDSGSAPTPHP